MQLSLKQSQSKNSHMSSHHSEHEARRRARGTVQKTLVDCAMLNGISDNLIWYERTIVDHPHSPEMPSEIVLLVSVGIVGMVEEALSKCELPNDVLVTIQPYSYKNPPQSILHGDAFSLKENWGFSPALQIEN